MRTRPLLSLVPTSVTDFEYQGILCVANCAFSPHDVVLLWVSRESWLWSAGFRPSCLFRRQSRGPTIFWGLYGVVQNHHLGGSDFWNMVDYLLDSEFYSRHD